MPKSNEICGGTKYSNACATLFHETENLVSIHDGQVVTTSLQVAEVFNKNHFDVLKAIKGLDCSAELRDRNFACTFYYVDMPNNAKRKEPMYYIGKDGFIFLVMGFTGKLAAKFKEEYINAFNEMEEMLRKSQQTKYAEKLFDDEVMRFCKDLKKYVREKQMDGRRYFGGAGELRPGLFYYPDKSGDYKQKLETVFNQLRSAYADAFSFVEEIHLTRNRLNAVERSVRDFIEDVKGNVTLF